MDTNIGQCYYSKNWQCCLSCNQWTVPRWSSYHQILFSGWFPCQLGHQLFASQWVTLQGHLIFGSISACSFCYMLTFLLGKGFYFYILQSLLFPLQFGKQISLVVPYFLIVFWSEVVHWGIFYTFTRFYHFSAIKEAILYRYFTMTCFKRWNTIDT